MKQKKKKKNYKKKLSYKKKMSLYFTNKHPTIAFIYDKLIKKEKRIHILEKNLKKFVTSNKERKRISHLTNKAKKLLTNIRNLCEIKNYSLHVINKT